MANPEWRRSDVASCLDRLTLTGKKKVQSQHYRARGRFPVIDQGQQKIAGWTDDSSAVIDAPLPLVVFGDHTCALKYVDFPFARGADGTQLLRPRAGIDPLYFYYACRALKLPTRGYNRHFTLLKEQLIPIPSIGEQRGIAGVLRQSEDALNQQALIIDAARGLKKRAMRQLFTRGYFGKAAIETDSGTVPDGWVPMPVGRLGNIITGTTPPTANRSYYDGGRIQFISPGDIEDGLPIRETQKKITDAGLTAVRPLPAGTVCVVCIGSTIGKVGITTAAVSATNQQINAVVPRDEWDKRFVAYLMSHWADRIRAEASRSPVPILSKGAFERIQVYVTTDAYEQTAIANVLASIDDKIEVQVRKRAVLQQLFAALLRKLMSEEISVSDLDCSRVREGPPVEVTP